MERIATASIAMKMTDAASVQACAFDVQVMQSAGLVTVPPATSQGISFHLQLRALSGAELYIPPHVRAIIDRVTAKHEAGLRYLADK